MWPHFINLFERVLHGIPLLVSSNWADKFWGFGVFLLIQIFLALNNRHHMRRWWESKWRNLLIGIVAVAIGYFGLFIWSTVQTIYDEHHDTMRRWQDVVNEKNAVKEGLRKRDDYIKVLESRSCPKCSAPPISKSEAQHPETIQDIVATVRTTCVLRDPSRMPEDLPLMVPDQDSYLEGMIGKAYMYSRSATFKRTEQEGTAISIENFRSVPNSDLIGMEVSKMTDYSSFHVSLASVGGGQFSRCTFLEVTLRVNGRDVFRHGEPFNLKLDDVHGISFTIKLEGMNLT
jgi:hypothetical protein